MNYIVLIALAFFVTTAQSLSCVPCTQADLRKCIPPSQLTCPGGTVYSACSCCPECRKLENERCGGFLGQKGTCGSGLFCDLLTHTCRKDIGVL